MQPVNPIQGVDQLIGKPLMASGFFEEGRMQYDAAFETINEQGSILNNTMDNCTDFGCVLAETMSALGELCYCGATVNQYYPVPICNVGVVDLNQHPAIGCLSKSIKNLTEGLEMILIPTSSRRAGILDNNGLDLAVRCAKDLGKVCTFAKDIGVANIVEIDDQMLFDLAYILSPDDL